VEKAGARPQRLLWASTSPKNPSYDDLMYVEPLIGPQTINTLPQKTIAAVADHGKFAATLDEGLEEAQQTMRDLQAVGIDVGQVTRGLLDDGIAQFIEALNDILQTIATKAMTAPKGQPVMLSTRRESSAGASR